MTLSSSTPLSYMIFPFSPPGLKACNEGRKKYTCQISLPFYFRCVSSQNYSNVACQDLIKRSPGPAESDNNHVAEDTY